MRVAAAVHAEAPGGPAEEGDFSRAHPASAPPLLVVTRASGFSRGASRRVAAHVTRVYTRLSSRHSNPHRGSPRGTRRFLGVTRGVRPTVITRGYRVATRNVGGRDTKSSERNRVVVVVDGGRRLRPPMQNRDGQSHARTRARPTLVRGSR